MTTTEIEQPMRRVALTATASDTSPGAPEPGSEGLLMRLRTKNKGPWLVVLAGGDGNGLAPLTQSLYGYHLAKQFAVFRGTRSLLQKTLVRLRPHATPERTLVVSTRKWSRVLSEQLQAHPGVQPLIQPTNLGTGVGVLLALAHIRAVEPNALVLLSPSDHHVARPEALENALFEATREVARGRAPAAVIGITPDRPLTDYDWLVPDTGFAASSPLRRVHRLLEAPKQEEARALLATGAVWDSGLLAASIATLWQVAELELPAQTFLLQLYGKSSRRPGAEHLLARIFERMPPADFRRQLLARIPELAVATANDCGWSDLGTPQRVFDSLRDTGSYQDLLYRLARHELVSA